MYLELLRASEALAVEVNRLFREHGLTSSQYNVLRILRGAGREGLPSREIGNRMVSRDPDLTRILDALEREGWVSRSRGESDRRVVQARIETAGKRLLTRIDSPLEALHRQQLSHLGRSRLKQLAELLPEVRGSL